MVLHDIIQKAGEIALSFYGKDPEKWAKEDKSPVSEADISVNQFIIENLQKARPSYGYLSEESVDDPARLTCQKTWIIDPIDGTRAFLEGRPHWTISVALVEKNKPILASVFNPVSNEFFHAHIGGGAHLNKARIEVSNISEIEDSRLLINPRVFNQAKWKAPWPKFHEQSRSSMAYRLCLVAAGIFDGAVALSRKSDWDLAAADLLVREAGGIVTDHLGCGLSYNMKNTRHPTTVCAGPRLHAALLKNTKPLTPS